MRPGWLFVGLGPLLALASFLGGRMPEMAAELATPPVVVAAASEPQPAPAPEPASEPAPAPAPEPVPEPESAPDAVLAGYRIEIPKAGIRYMVQPDIGNAELEAGPGHYPQTARPGEAGNAAIAGHRTYGGKPSYFYHLDQLAAGDQILITYPDRQVRYTVEAVFVTTPFNLGVLDPTPYPALTLTTCDPPGTEDKRLIVRARLDS